jgi:hypothetical protein
VPDVGADLGWPLTARFADNPYRVAADSRLLAPVFVEGPVLVAWPNQHREVDCTPPVMVT